MTADSGPDSMLVVWDSLSGTPQRTYFSPHENGVISMDISPDASYIVTISDFIPQTISIWDITNEDLSEPIVSCTFGMGGCGMMMRPASLSAVVSGRRAMAAKLGTSALAVAAEAGETMWQPLHTRADNSRPRLGSAKPVCAGTGLLSATTQRAKIPSAVVSLILVLTIGSPCRQEMLGP